MPVLGALKAERGNVGRDLGPFLRAPTPTPGDMGGLGRLAMIRVVGVLKLDCRDVSRLHRFQMPMLKVSHVLRLCSLP